MKLGINGRTLVGSLVIPAAALLALVACGNGGQANSLPPVTTINSATAPGQAYTLEVLNGELAGKFGITAPDGVGHDTFVPSHMTVNAGQPVKITVYNYDEGPHTYTISELGISELVPAAKEAGTVPSSTTFTITFPKAGTFRWFCALPCDAGHGGWAMTGDRLGEGVDQTGFMGGIVTVL
jgi:plastocyanin